MQSQCGIGELVDSVSLVSVWLSVSWVFEAELSGSSLTPSAHEIAANARQCQNEAY